MKYIDKVQFGRMDFEKRVHNYTRKIGFQLKNGKFIGYTHNYTKTFEEVEKSFLIV